MPADARDGEESPDPKVLYDSYNSGADKDGMLGFFSDVTFNWNVENTDAGLDTAPDVVLYRNSASPAADDNLGNLEFRGRNAASEDVAYGQIVSKVVEDHAGGLDLGATPDGGALVIIRIPLFDTQQEAQG